MAKIRNFEVIQTAHNKYTLRFTVEGKPEAEEITTIENKILSYISINKVHYYDLNKHVEEIKKELAQYNVSAVELIIK